MPCPGGKYNANSESSVSKVLNSESTDEPNFDSADDCKLCSKGKFKTDSMRGECGVP